MSLSALVKRRQRARSLQLKEHDQAWKDAKVKFAQVACETSKHIKDGCTPVIDVQTEVLKAAEAMQEQIDELDTNLTPWIDQLAELDQAFMELGDLGHYMAVIARQAEIVRTAIHEMSYSSPPEDQ